MTLLMLDTSIVVAIMNQRADLDHHLTRLGREDWCISAITATELCVAAARKRTSPAVKSLAESFLAAARTVPFDSAAAAQYGLLRADLQARAARIGIADGMIAAHALSLGAVVVTGHAKRFEAVPYLEVEAWRKTG